MAPPPQTFGYWYYDNNIVVAVYAKKSGVWTKMTTRNIPISYSFYGGTSAGANRTFTWSVDDTFQLGTGVQGFGVSVDSTQSGSAAVTGFTHAKWQATGSTGGTRSATPNSEQSLITVRPQ